MNYRFTLYLFTFIPVLTESPSSAQEKKPLPVVKQIIDTHIHLYDTTREGGVPWPRKSDKVLYKPHLPGELSKVAKPAGVTGVVIVEASTRLCDNQWVLELVKNDDFFLGLVGNIDPYRKDFKAHLDKLRKDKRFVGIRARQKKKINYAAPIVRQNFKHLAEEGLTLDILMNGEGPKTIGEVDQLARAIPKLRIVVNHVLGYNINGKSPDATWIKAVKSLAANHNVHIKVSGLYQRCIQQPAPKDLSHYSALLEILWKEFGSKRLIYGSNWPCTKKSGDYASFVKLASAFITNKGQVATDRFFWKNATRVYKLTLKGEKR